MGIRNLLAPRSKVIQKKKLAVAISAQPGLHTALVESLPPDWDVIAAADLAQAIEILKTRPISIAMVDRDAPEWRAAVSRLAAPPYRLCVVLLSETSNPRFWHDVVCSGAYDVLVKPIRGERLAELLTDGFRHWRSQQALFAK